MLQHIKSVPNATGGEIKVSVTLNAELKLKVNMRYEPPHRGQCYLVLEQGMYETAIIPEQIQSLWGPVNFERLPSGRLNYCMVASHRLKNHTGQPLFTARTIHSAPLMMSVVQIFYLDRMVAIGHLIASDQLPMPIQVNDKNIPTLNPSLGERAVLIKNNEGDWGILTGKWVCFRKGTPRVHGTHYRKETRGESPESHGTLSVTFHSLITGKSETFALGYWREQYIFTIGPLVVHLKKGTVRIDDTCTTIAEHLVLAFSVSLLHVLCVLRPSGWTDGNQVIMTTTRDARTSTTAPSDDMVFILAAGLLECTPSNFYIRQHYGYHACAMCDGCEGYDLVGDFCDHAEELDAAQDGDDKATNAEGDGGSSEVYDHVQDFGDHARELDATQHSDGKATSARGNGGGGGVGGNRGGDRGDGYADRGGGRSAGGRGGGGSVTECGGRGVGCSAPSGGGGSGSGGGGCCGGGDGCGGGGGCGVGGGCGG